VDPAFVRALCEHTFVRWDSLTVEADQAARLPGYRDPAVVRTFDAPEALRTRFYEVHAKSALNRVPKASRMPFRWTVNPYRGCSHACKYCIRGDTPVLMADGTEKPIAALRVGDGIYGTEERDGVRRFAPTTVRDVWSTRKHAYRLRLADGTELVTSGEHRFLSVDGWRHVALDDRHPTLTVGDPLVAGAGAPADAAHVAAGADQRVVAIEDLGVELPMYDITTGTGDFIANGVVSHNCFARPTHTYLGFNAGEDFDHEIVVKVNAPEVLAAELRKPSWTREHVALGTNTDPYQWVEGRYKLMRGIWAAMRDSRTPSSILTKSPLVLRDLDLLLEVQAAASMQASFSVPTIDEKAWRASEPHTPNPRARLEAVGELNRAGIPTGILIAPLMPGINDSPEQVEEILQIAADNGATHVGGIALHLRGEVRDVFMDWLRSYRPDLVDHYERLYGRRAYAPPEERKRLARLIKRRGRFTGSRTTMPERDRWDREPTDIDAAIDDWAGAEGLARGSSAPVRARAPEQPSLF
jgi:DNA repair photolyase